MMIRSFLPVGQGAFYLEQFNIHGDRINVVYDCGSSTGIKYVKREIKENLKRNETVHAIFISHFDNDHINGIPYLLKYCNVKNIFLPIITERNKKIILLKYLSDSEHHSKEDFFYRFVFKPNELRELENIQLYYIDEYNSDNDKRRDEFYYTNKDKNIINTRFSDGIEQIQQIIFNENKEIIQDERNWMYIPFNFRQEGWDELIVKQLEYEFESNIDNIEINDIFLNSKKKKRLKKIFSTVVGDFNSNSMTLFSGIKSKSCQQVLPFGHWFHYLNHRCLQPIWRLNGCLYTGDYNASKEEEWNALYTAYRKYWKYIGCIQIPHHGSKYSYNKIFTHLDTYYVVSAGYTNRYHHPNAEVVKDFLYNGLFLNVVTEQIGSVIRLVID